MGFSVNFFNLLIMMMVSMDATSSAASASASLVVPQERRSISKWRHSYHSKEGDGNVKGLTFDSTGPGVKPNKQDSSKEYSTETQNSSNVDVEEIVYSIDYHGATTHPTPTPKHPKP